MCDPARGRFLVTKIQIVIAGENGVQGAAGREKLRVEKERKCKRKRDKLLKKKNIIRV